MHNWIQRIYDNFTGRCIRRIDYSGQSQNAIYLTFDDGPNPSCTPKVLELLNKHGAPSTFFVIGKKAKEHLGLTKKILESGHMIGNHTIDHDTTRYFSLSEGIAKWLSDSIKLLEDDLKISSVGFRSPVGIKTPPLNAVLRSLKWPLLLWDVRFYDTKNGLTKKAVERKLSHLTSGSIVLLHDTHTGDRQTEFLSSLEFLIVEAKNRGFHFLPLDKASIQSSYAKKYGDL